MKTLNHGYAPTSVSPRGGWGVGGSGENPGDLTAKTNPAPRNLTDNFWHRGGTDVFFSFFLYILLHPLSRIMNRCTLYTPVMQDESLQVIM